MQIISFWWKCIIRHGEKWSMFLLSKNVFSCAWAELWSAYNQIKSVYFVALMIQVRVDLLLCWTTLFDFCSNLNHTLSYSWKYLYERPECYIILKIRRLGIDFCKKLSPRSYLVSPKQSCRPKINIIVLLILGISKKKTLPQIEKLIWKQQSCIQQATYCLSLFWK